VQAEAQVQAEDGVIRMAEETAKGEAGAAVAEVQVQTKTLGGVIPEMPGGDLGLYSLVSVWLFCTITAA
jgi:hypothetical protein